MGIRSVDLPFFYPSTTPLNHMLETHGIRLRPEILAGVMKGLMVLWGEAYVNNADFVSLLGKEIKATLERHLPRTIIGKTWASGLGGWWLSAQKMLGD